MSYAARVRASPLQFWSLICLLVLRLAFGEFAHAMPHEMSQEMTHGGMTHGVDASHEHAAGCPDHATASDQPSQHENPTSQKNDCCKGAGCECPCLHASAILSCSSLRMPGLMDRMTAVTSTPGLVQDRLNHLFRPPA